MTSGSARLVVVCVAIVAAAGAAAYVLTDRQAATPPAAPHHEAAPATAQAPEAAPAKPAEAAPAMLTFEPLVQKFSLVRDSAAYANASLDAPQLYPLVSGTGLVSASRSTDGVWIIAMTQDGQAAYIPATDLGPYDPSRAPPGDQGTALVPGQVRGPAHVTNTATLVVDGKTLRLDGLLGKMGIFASQLQAQVDTQGPVTCTPSGTAFTCTLADGTDVGRLALAAGQAETAPDASAAYQQEEATAHKARRGVWR